MTLSKKDQAYYDETHTVRRALGIGINCNAWGHKDARFVKGSRYEKGQMFCARCTWWVKREYIVTFKKMKICPCCNSKLRKSSPYSKKDKRTEKGNRAFACFNAAYAELQNGVETMHLYYKISAKAGHIRAKTLKKNIELTWFFLREMKKYKRLRSERLYRLYEKVIILIEVTIEKMENTHEKLPHS